MSVNELSLPKSLPQLNSKSELVQRAYVESPDIVGSSMDVLRQFQANMATLEELNGRLRFMMGEIKGLIRK